MIRRALLNTGWLMGARGVNAVLSLAYLALATRALGPEGFGQFILAVMFAQVVVGFCNFQTWQAVVRWGQDDPEAATGFAMALDGLTILAGTIAAALILWLAGDWLPVPRELRSGTFAFTLVSLLAIRSTPVGILRLHDRYSLAAMAEGVTPVVRAIGAGLAAALSPDVPTFLLVWGIAELATAVMFWWQATRIQEVSREALSLRRLPAAEGDAWGFVAGTSLSGTLAIASRQVIVLLVGAIGGAALAGVYRVAAQLGEGLLKLGQALLRATYPELVRAPADASDIVGRIAVLASLTGLAALVLALVLGEWLVTALAGPRFLAAYWPLIWLTAAAALELAGSSFEALLVARGRAMLNFLLRAVPTVVALALLPWLIERAGASGAALAVLAASGATVASLLVASSRANRAG